MRQKLIFVILVLLAICSVAPSVIRAQEANPCLSITTAWAGDPPIPGFFYYYSYPGTFAYLIAAHLASCPPPDSNHCDLCGNGGAGPSGPGPVPKAAKPVEIGTGNTYVQDVDLAVPGLGGGLRLRRRWNSVWPTGQIATSVGMFGSRWRSTYEELLFQDATTNWLTYLKSDGRYVFFGLYSNGQFRSVGPGQTMIFGTSGPDWTVQFTDGEVRTFDYSTRVLKSIVDRNGNTTQLSYDSNGRLVTVTDSVSRHLYFNYLTGTNLVGSVTTDFGVTVSYGYDMQGRLTTVTRPDATVITYTYDSQSNITAVTDQNGHVLESHSYDSVGRGLTASEANGVNAVTISYQ